MDNMLCTIELQVLLAKTTGDGVHTRCIYLRCVHKLYVSAAVKIKTMKMMKAKMSALHVLRLPCFHSVQNTLHTKITDLFQLKLGLQEDSFSGPLK